jgi:hypothetical protein
LSDLNTGGARPSSNVDLPVSSGDGGYDRSL